MKKIMSIILVVCGLGLSAQTFVSTEAANRKVLIEEFTGIKCVYCPEGHKIANDIAKKNPESVFAINVHQGSNAIPPKGEPDFRIPLNDSLAAFSGIQIYPSAMINRHQFPSTDKLALARTSWDSAAEQILAMPAYANIAANANVDWESRELSVDVELYYTAAPTSGINANFIHVMLLQNNVLAYQEGAEEYNPAQLVGDKYKHMHILRAYVTGLNGSEVTEIGQGKFLAKNFTYSIPDSIGNLPVSLNDLDVIVFLTEGKNEVINAGKAQMYNINGGATISLNPKAIQINQASCDKRVRLKVEIDNKSTVDVNSIGFDVFTAGDSYEFTYSSAEALPLNVSTIEVGPLPLAVANEIQNIKLKITQINKQLYTYEEENIAEADVVKHFYQIDQPSNLEVELIQDQWGKEITWNFYENGVGEVLASGGGNEYKNLDDPGTAKNEHSIALNKKGCFCFALFDSEGDGINNENGEGSLVIKTANGETVAMSDGKYADAQYHYILIGEAVKISDASSNKTALELYPNPSNGQSFLRFGLTAPEVIEIAIFDLSGRKVYSKHQHFDAGTAAISLPTDMLSKGVYHIRLQGEHAVGSAKLVRL